MGSCFSPLSFFYSWNGATFGKPFFFFFTTSSGGDGNSIQSFLFSTIPSTVELNKCILFLCMLQELAQASDKAGVDWDCWEEMD